MDLSVAIDLDQLVTLVRQSSDISCAEWIARRRAEVTVWDASVEKLGIELLTLPLDTSVRQLSYGNVVKLAVLAAMAERPSAISTAYEFISFDMATLDAVRLFIWASCKDRDLAIVLKR